MNKKEDEKFKVLIGDFDESFAERVKTEFNKEENFETIGIVHDGESVAEAVKEFTPDVIIINIILPNLDSLTILESINQVQYTVPPVIIVISPFSSESMITKVMEEGAAYFFIKPFDIKILIKRVREIIGLSEKRKTTFSRVSISSKEDKNLDLLITQSINSIGIPANVKGYNYLRSAIRIIVRENKEDYALTKNVYPLIAIKYQTTPCRVERAIRHAIEITWKKNKEIMEEMLYGRSGLNNKIKPSNAQFIANLANKLKIRLA